MSFNVAVVEFPEKNLIGMKVCTDMQRAHSDCSALWKLFGPRIIEIPSSGNRDEAYGVSLMTSFNDFDYWAAVESLPETTIPFDMQTVAIPGGLYARCSVDRLEQLGEAYTYLYGEWIEQQSEYILNMQAACFELYPQNEQEPGWFEIYVPVSKK